MLNDSIMNGVVPALFFHFQEARTAAGRVPENATRQTASSTKNSQISALEMQRSKTACT